MEKTGGVGTTRAQDFTCGEAEKRAKDTGKRSEGENVKDKGDAETVKINTLAPVYSSKLTVFPYPAIKS